MTIIRYVDIYKTVTDEEGNVYDEIIAKNLTIPTIIHSYGISSISPYIGSNGKPFKNVTSFVYDNEMYKVVGNYKDINDRINNRIRIKGYYNAKQK